MYACFHRLTESGHLIIARFRVIAVPAAVMLRRIAMLRERRHDQIALYPVPVFPCGRLPEPYLIVHPIRLEHISGGRHVKIGQVTPFVKGGFPVLGVLNSHVQPLEYDE